jgi:ATP-dependent RNA helicase RhlE
MREIDRQKRLENPDFQGAFHEKKFKPAGDQKKKKSIGKKSATGNKPPRKGKTFKKTYHKKP